MWLYIFLSSIILEKRKSLLIYLFVEYKNISLIINIEDLGVRNNFFLFLTNKYPCGKYSYVDRFYVCESLYYNILILIIHFDFYNHLKFILSLEDVNQEI